jgi:CHASE2 domain-containing sensor protein
VGLATDASRAARSPFPGLDSFTTSADDAAVFAGRDAESELVTANLRAASLTILCGPSGVGKSSLLRAGVVHRVRQQGPRGRAGRIPAPTVIVHDEWAGEAGAALAGRVAALDDGPDDEPTLDVAIERWSAHHRGLLLIILDQFEEYLQLHGESEGDSFDRLFARTAGREDLPVHFLLSLRDDALAELDRYQGRIPALFGNYLRLPPMTELSARTAIVQPIARVNEWREQAGLPRVEVEDGLIDEVFADLTDPTLLSGERSVQRSRAGRAPIELAFLQLVMRRLWDADVTGDEPVLQRSTLHRLGGTDAIVAGHLDAQMDSLTREQRDTAAAMFGYLVTPSGAKIRYTAQDLAGYAQRPAAAVGDVLNALSRPDLRIIRRVPAPSGDDPEHHGYEIFHDVLAGAVRGWSLRNRAARLERQSRWLAAALGAAIAAVISLFAYAANPRLLQRLELGTVDLRFDLRGAASVDPRILLVGIDDRTLASPIRQPPPRRAISRSDQAAVLEAIDAGRPKVIVEDIEYATAGDVAQTRRLKAALRSARSPVVLATGRIDRAGQTTLFGGATPLNDSSARRQLNATIGYAGITPDLDGALRRVRGLGRQRDKEGREEFFGLPTIAVRAAELAGAKRVEFPDDGAWIDYAGPPGTYPHVSLADVRGGKVPAARFRDKIVVVGETSLRAADVHPTPADGGTRMSGPEIQANAIATVRRGLPLRDAPTWAAVLLIVALAVVPAALAIRGRAIMTLALTVAAGVVFLVGAQLAFGAGRVLPVVAALLALVLSLVAVRIATSVWPGGRTRGSAVVRP